MLAPSDLPLEQRRVVNTALRSLLSEPGSGRKTVLGRELRHVLVHLDEPDRQRVVDSCVPELLKRSDRSGLEQYEFTLDGILQADERKVESVLDGVLSLLRRQYDAPGGPRMELYSWAQIRAEVQGLAEDDFELAYQVINAASLGTGAGPKMGIDAATDPSYKFYVPDDLEEVVKCADAAALQKLRRSRTAASEISSLAAASAGRALPRIPGYTLGNLIGHGGGGMVFVAHEKRPNGVKRAIKLIAPHPYAKRQDPSLRFVSEVDSLSKLRHRAVVEYVASGVIEAPFVTYYLVMDYVDGKTLRDASEAMGYEQRAYAILQVLDGLRYTHEQGIFHRDVKCSNVIVRASDGQPILVDFGLAYNIDEDGRGDRTTSALGTYVPPEVQADPTKSRSPKHDIYQVGMTLYELFARSLPVRDSYRRLSDHDSSLDGLDEIVLKAIGPEAERYGTADAFAQDLGAWLAAASKTETPAHADVAGRVSGRDVQGASIISTPRDSQASQETRGMWKAWALERDLRKAVAARQNAHAQRDAEHRSREQRGRQGAALLGPVYERIREQLRDVAEHVAQQGLPVSINSYNPGPRDLSLTMPASDLFLQAATPERQIRPCLFSVTCGSERSRCFQVFLTCRYEEGLASPPFVVQVSVRHQTGEFPAFDEHYVHGPNGQPMPNWGQNQRTSPTIPELVAHQLSDPNYWRFT